MHCCRKAEMEQKRKREEEERKQREEDEKRLQVRPAVNPMLRLIETELVLLSLSTSGLTHLAYTLPPWGRE